MDDIKNRNITIYFEDDSVLVAGKPAGLAVQTRKIAEEDLESLLRKKISAGGNSGGKVFLSPVNRIDQPVEGLVLFAKTRQAADKLTGQLTRGEIRKIYEAEVYGTFPETEKKGCLKDKLYKDERTNISRVVNPGDKVFAKGKDAELFYEEVTPGKLKIRLITGRHHQIRVQLSHAGHPILGDFKYGTKESLEETKARGINRLMLTAKELTFKHPVSGEEMTFTFEHK